MPKRRQTERLLWSTSNAGMIISNTSVGGKLTLTNKRLVFEPNSINQLLRPSVRDKV